MPSLFVQPHYDDVALSCGGTLRAQVLAGERVHMITVFASEIVDDMVGEFAEMKHARWKLDDVDAVVARRREEDACAAKVLGCELRWLGLPDAIYRGDRYASDAQLYGPLLGEEFALAEHLALELMGLPEWEPGTRVYVPLGVGNHADHQLVFEAGRALAARGVEVWAYEDAPYAIHTPAGVDRRLGQVGEAVDAPVLRSIAQTLPARLDAIACYASQVPVIFRFTDDFREAVARYSTALGAGVPAERFWRVRAAR